MSSNKVAGGAKGKKEPIGSVSLLLPAQQANPAPPVGSTLGQRGLNIPEFCKQFNDACKKAGIEPGLRTTVIIEYFADKSFRLDLKSPPVSELVKKRLGLSKSSSKPGTDVAATINMKDVNDIAKMKMKDMGVDDMSSAVSMVVGTCRSMGIKVAG